MNDHELARLRDPDYWSDEIIGIQIPPEGVGMAVTVRLSPEEARRFRRACSTTQDNPRYSTFVHDAVMDAVLTVEQTEA